MDHSGPGASQGFRLYLHNLKNQEVEVECNDENMTSYVGKLLNSSFDHTNRTEFIEIQTSETQIIRIDCPDISFIRATQELDFNPIHENKPSNYVCKTQKIGRKPITPSITEIINQPSLPSSNSNTVVYNRTSK